MLSLLLLLFAQFTVPAHTGALAVAPSGCSAPPATSLLAWYKADTLSASPVTTWADSSTNGNTLTATASPTWAAGQINGLPAVTLDGATQYFTLASDIPWTGAISIYIIFKPASVTAQQAFVSGYYDGGFQYGVDSATSQQVAIQQGIVALGDGTTVLTAGTAYEGAVTYDGSTVHFYHNGAADGSTSAVYTLNQGIDYIGAGNGTTPTSRFTDGQIAEILIYSTATYQTAVHTYLNCRYGL